MDSLLALCLLGLVYSVQGFSLPELATDLPMSIGGCADDWLHFQGNCYYRESEKMKFRKAEAFCVDVGAHLASVHSQEENDFIASELGRGWLGMMILAAKGWKNGEPWTSVWTDSSDNGDFANWKRNAPRFPVKQGRNSGLYVKSNKEWDDFKLSKDFFPICKKPVSGAAPPELFGVSPPEMPEELLAPPELFGVSPPEMPEELLAPPEMPEELGMIGGGRGCWFPMDVVQGAQHGYGAIARKDLETLEACKRECEDKEKCIGIDWNRGESPFLDTRCWTHMGAVLGPEDKNENPDMDHYAKSKFMLCE